MFVYVLPFYLCVCVGIQSMESNFIQKYLIAIDEEKDPQILHLIFRMNVIIIREFPSGKQSIHYIKQQFIL